MSEEPKQSPSDIKVTDRRSFTSGGERRDPDQPRLEAARVRPPNPSPVGEADGTPPAACDFLSFAHHLGRVALQQMVGMRDPATGEVVSSLDGAKETIEILRMLKLKTQGNLTPDEAKFLQQVLSELQLEFARRARSAKP